MIGSSRVSAVQRYGSGLDGLVVGDTAISDIDGRASRLLYRGHSVEDLAEHATFEEVSHLVLFGRLPDRQELGAWKAELIRWRQPPEAAFDALDRVPVAAHPLAKYRTMLTVAACHVAEIEGAPPGIERRTTARILSWTAALAAGAIRHARRQHPVPADSSLGFAANFLYQALGRRPEAEEERAFDASLIAQAEHGLHAAAFAALIVISTGADLGSAVLAGMGALSGVRHGAANQLAFEMLETLHGPGHAREWARGALARGHRFPGFGHRVYRCPDPRVRVLEPYARRLLHEHGMAERWDTYLALREEVEEALGPRGIYANVDGITGLVYHPMGLPASAFPIPFCLAIQTGWMAHCLEYEPDGPMISPGAVYVG